MRTWFIGLGVLAGVFGAAGVALAAVGAHRSSDPNIVTAAHFLLFHAPALIALCAVARVTGTRSPLIAASLIALGAFLFSGELALKALTGMAPVPLAAPTGGLLMILGWLAGSMALGSAFGSVRTP